ncbi:peptidoglycan recognition protein [Streptomyces sp. NPDC088768]|uniref:peptidoglycan recognition protein family protein n=1 Tax=Streptomyces sp. NPDC088768 TaxID=3365894 RepID=UPI0037F8E682
MAIQTVLRKRRVWGTAATATALAVVTGVLVTNGGPGGGGTAQAAKRPAPHAVRTALHTVAVKAEGDQAALGKRDTGPFSLLGLSWTKPAAELPGTVRVRARAAGTGTWGAWQSLGTEGDGTAQPESTRGATEPLWVGPSDGVQVDVDGRGSALPAGLRLELVDPGKSPAAASDADPAAFVADDEPAGGTGPVEGDEAADADSGTGTADPASSPTPAESTPGAESSPAAGSPAPGASAPVAPSAPASPSAPAAPTTTATTPAAGATTTPPPTAPPSTAPRPPIVTRAQWGADESMNDEAPEYGTKVEAVFVHHTVDANSYSCDQSAAMVRAIRTYHIKTNGWKDVGYHFLVDKCGTIFEGRKGGVDLPVIGAHTYGFNTDTTGVAVLGDYNKAAPSSAAKTAVARIAAWKLGQYKEDPTGKVGLVAGADGSGTGGKFKKGQTVTLNRISGHRDGYATECPGTRLYAALPEIRTLAGGAVAGLKITGFTGAGVSGTKAWTKGTATVRWSATTPSTLVNRYEVLVDGKVSVTAKATATSAALTFASGTHTVAVRAVHVSGRASTTANTTVVVDRTAPSFGTKPSTALRTGTVGSTSVPVTLKWAATDAAALKEVRLTKPSAVTYGPTTKSASLTAKPAATTTWSLTAYDQAGNTASASTTSAPAILQESSGRKTGKWTTKSSSSYLGGKSYSSSAKNASLTYTFTGRGASLVFSRASTSGQVYVYVDGVKKTTVDLKSSTTKYRDAQWTTAWSKSGKHTVKVVVVATKGRPTITTDGLVYLK